MAIHQYLFELSRPPELSEFIAGELSGNACQLINDYCEDIGIGEQALLLYQQIKELSVNWFESSHVVNFQLSRASTLIDFGSVSTVLKESNLFELLEGQLAKLVVCFPKDEDINELYSSCITRIIYKYLVESQLEAALNLLPKVANNI
ncbi:MAG: hypothetical protein HRT53_11300 [Colwellia sp.]|nr:hypothetical protein [Colwellia sp.]